MVRIFPIGKIKNLQELPDMPQSILILGTYHKIKKKSKLHPIIFNIINYIMKNT